MAVTKKKAVKKAAAKKPVKKAVKKPVAKPAKKAVKKAAKKPVAKAAAKKPAKKAPPKKPAVVEKKSAPVEAAEPVKKEIHRVPPRIVRKPSPNARPPEEDYVPIDTAKAVAFAMSIAQEMKRTAAEVAAKREKEEKEEAIRLSRRPTTRTQGKSTEKFPQNDLKEFRRRLLEARQRAANGVSAMKADGFSETDDHEADGGDGTAQTLRLQALGQVGNINRTIQKIDEALHRIDDGTYGVCTVCGQLIRKPRLLNQPFVLTCMECQNEMERAAK